MDRRVSQEDAKSLASQMNAVFIETSAKENRVPNRNDVTHSSFWLVLLFQNVCDVFTKLIAEMEKIDGDLPDEKKCVIS